MEKPVNIHKNAVTYAAKQSLFKKLQEHESLLSTLDKGSATRVLKGTFTIRDSQVCVLIQVYTIDSYEIGEPDLLSPVECVNAATDWFHHDTLWFRKENRGYVAFIEYLEDYRDRFSVKGLDPVLEFAVTL